MNAHEDMQIEARLTTAVIQKQPITQSCT